METKNFFQTEWRQAIIDFDDLSLIQLWEYGESKSRVQGTGIVRHLFWQNDQIVGAAQAVIKKTPILNRGVVWINRAPLWQKKGVDEGKLVEMLLALKQYWVIERKMYLRIAPTLSESVTNQKLLTDIGFASIADTNWVSARIDLSQDLFNLRNNLDKKWRNCLQKAENLGVRCEIGQSQDILNELLVDQERCIKERNFQTQITPEFIKTLQSLLPQDSRMLVFAARLGGERLGSILLAKYGKTVEYLVGAVGGAGKKVNAGQYLLWKAMETAKLQGFTTLDVGGAHPIKTPPGIMHFKEGLGGESYGLVGEFDSARSLSAKLLKIIIPYLT